MGELEGGGRLTGPGLCDCTNLGVSGPQAVARVGCAEWRGAAWGLGMQQQELEHSVAGTEYRILGEAAHGVMIPQPVTEEPKGK